MKKWFKKIWARTYLQQLIDYRMTVKLFKEYEKKDYGTFNNWDQVMITKELFQDQRHYFCKNLFAKKYVAMYEDVLSHQPLSSRIDCWWRDVTRHNYIPLNIAALKLYEKKCIDNIPLTQSEKEAKHKVNVKDRSNAFDFHDTLFVKLLRKWNIPHHTILYYENSQWFCRVKWNTSK
jgi:hypothetical protein